MDFREFMDRDEEILWEGRPSRGLLLRASDIFAIPFSLLWGGFALFWFGAVLFAFLRGPDEGSLDVPPAAAAPFLIVGALFSLIGLYMILGRFVVDMARRACTHYAVTDRRALIYGGLFSQELVSQPLTRSLLVRVSGRDRGSIKLGPGHGWLGMQFMVWGGPSHPFMFERIRDVRSVYELVRRVQETH